MRPVLLFLSLLLMFNQAASATGLIIVHEEDFWRRPPPRIIPPQPVPPPRGVPQPRWAALETSFTKAHARIKEQFATTSVEQEFYNPENRRLEGTFLFPVPKGAHLDKFTMEINGKPVEAELLAADKARGIYEDIVRKLQDPALLEYAGRDLFKVRIFPIEPHERKRITLSYSQLLKSDSGLVTFALPLNTDKYSAKPLKSLSVKVELENQRPLNAIYSPSHKVEIKRHGPNRATVGFEASEVKPETDFQLMFAPEQREMSLNLLTYQTGKEDGYFVLLASPGIDQRRGQTVAKDVTFVLDTSGSMAGAKLEQAKKALAFCVENLNDNDRFEVLRFATEAEPLFNQLEEASKERRARAQSFIKDLKPIGGTAIDDALQKALALRPNKGDRPYLIIFLTDGRPTVGNTREEDILANVKRVSQGNVRVFCFGIGTDVNTHLLDKITEDTRAVSQYVLPEEDIEVKVSNFFGKVREPALASPTLRFPNEVRVTKLYPAPLPDLFKGDQLVVVGRYSGQADGAIEIEGSVNGEKRKFADDVRFRADHQEHEFIPRLWATRRVGYLLDEIRLRGENSELKDEVVELARKYSIVTPYTAYLITEDEARRGVASRARTWQFDSERDLRLAKKTYDSFMMEKGGEAGVSGARSYAELKQAQTSSDAIAMGNNEALRAGVPFSGRLSVASPTLTPAEPGKPVSGPAAAASFQQFSRFVGGKTFYQNQNQWVDSEVQKVPNAPKVRVQFGSPEYFDLMKKHASAVQWMSVGANVQFVANGTLYEVHE